MSVDVHGTCDPRFESVRRTFAGNLESGADVGASFAVTMNGEMVVDLWGGWADPGQLCVQQTCGMTPHDRITCRASRASRSSA